MTSLLVLVCSFLIIFCGNIKPMVGQDIVARNSSIAGNSSIVSSQCVDSCNKVASETTILNSIVSRQDREMQSLVEIKAKVVDDFPSELEKLSTDLDAVKTAVTDGIPSSLKLIEDSLVSLLRRIETVSRNLQLVEGRLKVQEQLFQTLNSAVKEMRDYLIEPKDCSDIRAFGHSTSGVYRVYPGSLGERNQTDVYCDMTTPGGSWLVFQRRKDGSQDFEQTWSDYVQGFGNLNGEFWLGNEALYLLTSNRNYKLRIDMEDFDGQKRYAEYSTFSVGSSADRYRLTVAGYTGDAGDSFSDQNGMQFSTKDADNDVYKEGSCSLLYHGGWWYSACHTSNLNGPYLSGPHTSYADGIEWNAFRGFHYSLKTTEMKIAIAK